MSHKKKKIYAGVVVLGLIALVVDRILAPGPSPVSAASLVNDELPSKPLSDGPAGSGQAAADIEPEAFPRLSPLSDAQSLLRDAFAPHSDVLEQLLQTPQEQLLLPAEPVEPEADPRTSAADFAGRHTLGAVMQGARTSFIIVDGKRLNVGDSLDDCVLMSVTGRTASFECFDGPAELTISAHILP
jgi:hypothetical protein